MGAGILGCMETHEQEIIVARQLQRISHVDRSMAGQMHAASDVSKIVVLLLDSARELARGAACV